MTQRRAIMKSALPIVQRRLTHPRYHVIVAAILTAGTLFLIFQTVLSLQWYLAHDSSYFHTIAFLIDRYDFVPYRDIFQFSLPLNLLFHLAIGKTLGYGDQAFRVVDVIYLGALLFMTWRVMRPFGGLVAWGAALSFGLLYQSFGATMTLQRDYLCLLPAATAIWLAGDVKTFGRGRWRYLAIGALFGLAVSIKPHSGIGLPPVLLYALFADEHLGRAHSPIDWRALVKPALLTGAGLAFIVALPLLWLQQSGGLPSFWDMMTHYIPLYNQLNGNQELLGPGERWIYVFNTAQMLGSKAGLLMTAALGIYFGLVDMELSGPQRRLVVLLAALMPLYVVYELFAGKFWTYHWMPFFYFATCCGALVLLPLQERTGHQARQLFALTAFVAGMALTLRPAPDVYNQVRGQPPAPIAGGRADAITAFLRRELHPGDTVQLLDGVTGGSMTALRRAEARLATPYIDDYQFYHHVSTDYIQGLRRDFLARLQAAPPRFMIYVPSPTRPHGVDSADFPELDNFLAAHYHPALAGDDFTIYERNASLASPLPPAP